MPRPKVKLHSGSVRALLNSSGVADHLLERANRALAAAQASAPVETGAYRASLRAEIAHTDRAVGRVVADVPYAVAVEANTGNLSRALDAAGGG